MGDKLDKPISAKKVGDLIRDVKLKEDIGVSRYENPLTPQQVLELKEWKDYLKYDEMLEERNDLLIEIESKRNIIKNLDKNIEEYKGGLGNYRATELNTAYHTLSKVIDMFVGFLSAGIIYNGLSVWKTPSLWIYSIVLSIIYLIIGTLESQRYNKMKRRG